MRTRTIVIAVIVASTVAGCTGAPAATHSPAQPVATTTAPPTPRTSTTPRIESPSASTMPNAVFTADDEAIAKLIKAGAQEAIPQLRLLNDMDPSGLEDLFLPLDTWITSQKADVAAFIPSSCTSAAMTLFIEAMDAYDEIRQTFLDWRDWGANGLPFSRAAPPKAVGTFEEAVAELEVHCPA